ncbi:hypothetical protein P3T18_001089 [Paraburkholderia sp. GAS199]
MNEEMQSALEQDAKVLEAEQIAEDELTLSLSQLISNKEWQE